LKSHKTETTIDPFLWSEGKDPNVIKKPVNSDSKVTNKSAKGDAVTKNESTPYLSLSG